MRSGVKPSKLRFIPEPLDTDLFKAAAAGTQQHPALPGKPRTDRSWLDETLDARCDFVFLSVFAWSDRKGWDVLLRGFFSEFQRQERVCLLLRTYSKSEGLGQVELGDDLSADVRRRIAQFATSTFCRNLEQLAHVAVAGQRLEVQRMPELYAAADAFVLPTRGEGWGRPIAEAMAMGLPTIATNWSGHTLFANDTTSWPVPLAGLSCIDNVQHAGLYARHRWAEPSVAGLRRSMRQVYTGVREQDPELLARAHTGQAVIASSYSRDAVGRLVQRELMTDSRSLSGGSGAGWEATDPEAAASLRAATAEVDLDEALLRNLYDAATGRTP